MSWGCCENASQLILRVIEIGRRVGEALDLLLMLLGSVDGKRGGRGQIYFAHGILGFLLVCRDSPRGLSLTLTHSGRTQRVVICC